MTTTDPPPPRIAQRIAAIDALRGFDMFFLVGGKRLVLAISLLFADPLPGGYARQFKHADWEGFTGLDLVMPLFLFIVGTAMPFSLGRRLQGGQSKLGIYWKIVRRTLILFVLGMVAQGNLLRYDLSELDIYCNTLQAIAVGYFVASVTLLHLSIRWQGLLAVVLMVGYWLLMVLVPFQGHSAGVLQPEANLALYIDHTVLGHFEDGKPYTWVLSSMGFAATVILGVMAGHLLKSGRSGGLKFLWLTAAGLGCLALGWLWGLWFPIIKHVWTSSMILWAAGWSYLLLALFYGLIDVVGLRRWAFPFIVIGMNAIVAYMAPTFVDFGRIGNAVVGDIGPYTGQFTEPIRALAAFMVLWLMLYYMYRKGTFVRI